MMKKMEKMVNMPRLPRDGNINHPSTLSRVFHPETTTTTTTTTTKTHFDFLI